MFIGGLLKSTTDENVKSYFETNFNCTVDNVELIYEKRDQIAPGQEPRPRGFAFVTIRDTKVVDQICDIRKHNIDGKDVEAKKATSRTGPREMVVVVDKVVVVVVADSVVTKVAVILTRTKVATTRRQLLHMGSHNKVMDSHSNLMGSHSLMDSRNQHMGNLHMVRLQDMVSNLQLQAQDTANHQQQPQDMVSSQHQLMANSRLQAMASHQHQSMGSNQLQAIASHQARVMANSQPHHMANSQHQLMEVDTKIPT